MKPRHPVNAVANQGPSSGDGWSPPVDARLRDLGIAVLWAALLLAPMFGLGGWILHAQWRAREDARLALVEAANAYECLLAAPPADMLPVDELVKGREVFASTCVACHGALGLGVPGLGRNLVESDFVAMQSDEQLQGFLIKGRPEARPVAMPPRGGRDDLTDQDLGFLVMYLRGLQDPRRMPELPALAVSTQPMVEQAAAALEAAGGDAELAEYIASGDRIFHTACVACHGRGGTGIAGNGKALASNSFIQSLDDDALLDFIKKGRTPTDPKNTTGIQMPPKGGNPAMSDDDILDVIAYLRTLQPKAAASASTN
ncbi:MAG: c-type cytochrome [Phycisphaeraceae bacterium]|nr:c-type cytochrome [Phycisphaerae bacterium]MBX3391700.1 c-type cytochrome [Phycisphaeraceae bacterium]HRJ49920.1 c-type cytochrome [Phycisphaerales bacterium]